MAVILIECFNFLKDLVRIMNAKRSAEWISNAHKNKEVYENCRFISADSGLTGTTGRKILTYRRLPAPLHRVSCG